MAKTLTDLSQLTKAILKESPPPRPVEKPAPEPPQSREDADAAAEWFGGKLKAAFGASPKIKAVRSSGGAKFEPEEYALSANPGSLVVKAAGAAGVKHAYHTLRQIAIADRGGVTSRGWIMPAFEIRDKPSIAFRGVHLCWFPEQRVARIESAIRLAAYYKFNHVVLENWGVWRSEKHPWFGWPDGPMTKTVIRHLVDVARDAGVCRGRGARADLL